MAGHAERLVLVEAGGLGLRFPVSVVREVALVEGFNSAGRAFGDASEGFARIRDELIPVLTVRDLLGLKTRDASQVYALVLRIEQRVTAIFIDRIVDVVASDGLQTDEVSALTPSATPDLAAQVSNFEGQPFLDITDAVLRRAVFVADHTAKKIERMSMTGVPAVRSASTSSDVIAWLAIGVMDRTRPAPSTTSPATDAAPRARTTMAASWSRKSARPRGESSRLPKPAQFRASTSERMTSFDASLSNRFRIRPGNSSPPN
ncbi:chemotaxis protein CheW [Phenylobacterium sp.]|uniref:chemotaxis protein CheW n=1 Tax=Phenylobacterium sp. TaxID=1871053 RepID=UPI0035B14E90